MHSPKILVVEDVEQNRKILRKTVLSEYSDVLEAANGIEALGVLKEHNDIDLILLDLMMPKMDGIEFMRNLNNKDKDIPIIVLSSTSEVKMAVDSLRLGARDFIEKPYNKSVIQKKVNELIFERTSMQEFNVLFIGDIFSYGELQAAFKAKNENIFVVPNFNEAYELLKDAAYSVMVIDLSNNKDAILPFLKEIYEQYPYMVSVVTAREEDKIMVYDLVDEGLIRDMVLDPIDINEISMTVMNSLLYFQESEELRRIKSQKNLQ